MKIIYLILVLFLDSGSIYGQNLFDIVIDEIMADPSPSVALPNSEWIELKNVSNVPIELKGWHIGDLTGQSGPLPEWVIQPDSFVIICSSGALISMSQFGSAISVSSFPSLNSIGETIFVSNSNGVVVHAVNYSDTWYRNDLKKEGGWSLEMIDTRNPCSGVSNWEASENLLGATPGKRNSIDAINPDLTSPRLKYAYALDSVTLVLIFDESLDRASAINVRNYNIDRDLAVLSAELEGPAMEQVQLRLDKPLHTDIVYSVAATNLFDCSGNGLAAPAAVKVGLPIEPSKSDVVINEILFNPRPNAYDYVEFVNRSAKIIDASKLFVANRNGIGSISPTAPLSPYPFYVFPGDYIVVTEDASNLATNYLVKNAGAVLEIASMPSFPDDSGDVILLNAQGSVVDEVAYSENWQFKLINDPQGVALEKIDPERTSQASDNWHSAASSAGYGTPGYKNSQLNVAVSQSSTIEVTPQIFSPDNDGRDDIEKIQYTVNGQGFVANLIIFDATGRPVRYLVKNEILGVAGQWNWDGLDDKGNRLPIGSYVLYVQIFNLNGKKQEFKRAIVLARKLN